MSEQKKFSLGERIFTYLLIGGFFLLVVFALYMGYKYFWPNKFDPSNLWYNQYDPEVFCKAYAKGTSPYYDCLETLIDLREQLVDQA